MSEVASCEVMPYPRQPCGNVEKGLTKQQSPKSTNTSHIKTTIETKYSAFADIFAILDKSYACLEPEHAHRTHLDILAVTTPAFPVHCATGSEQTN